MHHIALVLRGVGTTSHSRAIVGVNDAGMVAGGHRIETKLARTTDEPVELEVTVALDARVRRVASHVRIHIGRDHVLVEIVGKVEHHVVDAELLGHTACIVNVGDRAAPCVALPAPQSHRHPDGVMTLVAQKQCCSR